QSRISFCGATIQSCACLLRVIRDQGRERDHVRYAPKATALRSARHCREWDCPPAPPPPTALRVGGGLSGAGAPPCRAGPPFAQSPPSELIWVRTHFTWSASICTVPSCCERRSRVDASYRGLRTCHPASLASKREWQRTTLHVSLRRLAMM